MNLTDAKRHLRMELYHLYFATKPVCNATRFAQMIDQQDPVDIVRKLAFSGEQSVGFLRLIDAGRPELTLEAAVLVAPNSGFYGLFTPDERSIAAATLRAHGVDVQ